jgi:hypothetical protein
MIFGRTSRISERQNTNVEQNPLENISFEGITGEARLYRYIFKIYESLRILVLKTEISVTHYFLGRVSVQLGKIKLPFRSTRDDGKSIQNKLYHI